MSSKTELIVERINESINTKKDFLSEAENIAKASDAVIKCIKNGNKVLICGNGGSAADSQHIAGELVGRYLLERKALPVLALSTDSSILTAWSNDYSFESVFCRQVEAFGKSGDVLIGISTSGNSENVFSALKLAKKMGMVTISFTGRDGGKIKTISDININSVSKDTPRVQECHQIAYHTMCELIEKEINE